MSFLSSLGSLCKVCYATKNSEGDDEEDFKTLGLEIEILPDTATRPGMVVPRSVLLGQVHAPSSPCLAVDMVYELTGGHTGEMIVM